MPGLSSSSDGMMNKIRILIVDDHVVMREGLVSLLSLHTDFEVVGEAGTLSDAVEKAREMEPDTVLMDIGLPDGTGVEATRKILAERPETRIVMLTIHDTDEMLLDALRSGARGYLLKNTSATNLIGSLRALSRGEAALSRMMTGRVLTKLAGENHSSQEREAALSQLTARELQILQKISSGDTNKEIAKELVISVNTVKNHVHEILGKLNLKNRREAGLYAVRHGLDKTDPEP